MSGNLKLKNQRNLKQGTIVKHYKCRDNIWSVIEIFNYNSFVVKQILFLKDILQGQVVDNTYRVIHANAQNIEKNSMRMLQIVFRFERYGILLEIPLLENPDYL